MQRFEVLGARQRSLSPDQRKPHARNLSRVVSLDIPNGRDFIYSHGKISPSLVNVRRRHSSEFGSQPSGELHSLGYEDSRISSPSRARRFSDRGAAEADLEVVVGLSSRVAQSPIRARFGSPLKTFLSRAKRPDGRERGSSSSEPQSSRGSSAGTSEVDSVSTGGSRASSKGWQAAAVDEERQEHGRMRSGKCESRRKEGESLVIVAFDANVREMSHGAILWALENALKRGDVLNLVGILEFVRGPLGYRYPVADQTWLGSNRKVVEEEIKVKKRVWSSIPGLANRCKEAGVKLVVDVKPAKRPEVTLVAEAIRLDASHLVLDKSLKNRQRQDYLDNLACNVTRMRRNGGVDAIRPFESKPAGGDLYHQCLGDLKLARPPSPTSVIQQLPLSYRHQTDVFEITLRPKKIPGLSPDSSANATSVSATPQESVRSQVRPSFTSSSDPGDETDDELFSIYHGSTRHKELDVCDLFSLKELDLSKGYESDDLFSICNASVRRESCALSGPPLDGQSFRSYSTVNSNESPAVLNPRLLRVSDADPRLGKRACTLKAVDASVSSSPSSSCRASTHDVTSEPLTEATISRMTFVVGLGDAVEVNLCHPLRPGEALMVGSSPSALFLVHAERHLRGILLHKVSAGPPNAYVAMEGRMAMKLASLEAGQRVMAVDAHGMSRTVVVGHTATHPKPLVLVEALAGGRRHSVMLHHTESVCLVAHGGDSGIAVSVNDLKAGDRVLLRLSASQSVRRP